MKSAKLRIPRQIWFWPVAESAYKAKNAQFGLVRIGKLNCRSSCAQNFYTYQLLTLETVSFFTVFLKLFDFSRKVSFWDFGFNGPNKLWKNMFFKRLQTYFFYKKIWPSENLNFDFFDRLLDFFDFSWKLPKSNEH